MIVKVTSKNLLHISLASDNPSRTMPMYINGRKCEHIHFDYDNVEGRFFKMGELSTFADRFPIVNEVIVQWDENTTETFFKPHIEIEIRNDC